MAIPISYEVLLELTKLRLEQGFTLADVENAGFMILFIRFLFLAMRYNMFTGLEITVICFLSGYMWYRHLIDLMDMYRRILIGLPYLRKLGIDAVQLRTVNTENALNDIRLGQNVQWYNPGGLLYYTFINGITRTDPATGLKTIIDPLSIEVSYLSGPAKEYIVPLYYKLYGKWIPGLFNFILGLYGEVSGIAAYALITRVGKRYCPYLIRWHWTLLLLVAFGENMLYSFIYRLLYFQANVLIPQINVSGYLDQNIMLQVKFLNLFAVVLICLHLAFIFFGMFHALLGQYFYLPIVTETAELHIGPRPKNSVYSGGMTAWQDEKNQNIKRVIPKIWFGFFGNGKVGGWNIFKGIWNLIKFLIKKTKALIKKLQKRF